MFLRNLWAKNAKNLGKYKVFCLRFSHYGIAANCGGGLEARIIKGKIRGEARGSGQFFIG